MTAPMPPIGAHHMGFHTVGTLMLVSCYKQFIIRAVDRECLRYLDKYFSMHTMNSHISPMG